MGSSCGQAMGLREEGGPRSIFDGRKNSRAFYRLGIIRNNSERKNENVTGGRGTLRLLV